MHAVTAVAGHRHTGAPEYFLVRMLVPGDPVNPVVDTNNEGVVYSRKELIELLDASEQVIVLLPGAAPQPLRAESGTHGYRYVTSVTSGAGTRLLHKVPRFAFVREARAIDIRVLNVIAGVEVDPPLDVPGSLVQRYVDFGWIRQHADGERELTSLGRALLAHVRE